MDPHNEAVLTGRKRRRSNLALGCLLLLGVLWMCCMGVTLFGGATSWYYNKELDEKGVVVDGVVMKRRENPGTRNTAASYYVTYVFKLDPDGRPYTREQQVSLHTYATAFSSATVQIKVLPSDPEHSTLVGDSTERDSAISTVRLSMVCLVGLTIILPMFYVARRRSGSPKRRGQILRGEIVAARAEPSSAGDLWLRVECCFVTPDGQTITHTERRMRNDLGRTRLPPDGAPVAVLYRSPQNFEIL